MSQKTEAIIYQIYPRSFKDLDGDGYGDLLGIKEKVPYLKSLGINWVWLSPIYLSPFADNGYDIADYLQIDPLFGTKDDLKALIETLHDHDIKLMMDLVFNHTSDEHHWFKESRKSVDNPYRDYYIWRKGKGNRPPNNWTSFFTGSAWTYDETTDMYYLHLFDPKQPDLNWENPNVRADLKTICEHWIDFGVDGFRLDVINLISKVPGLPDGKKKLALTGFEHYANGPKVHEYLREFGLKVFEKHGSMTVGETIFVTPEDGLRYTAADRHELDMVFHFDHMGVDNINNKWFIVPFRPRKLKRILDTWQRGLEPNGWNALYLENHDQPRSLSRFGDDKTFRDASAKMLSALLILQRGTPFIYQGQEIGMSNVRFENLEQYRDIETKNVYRIGRKQLRLSHRRMMKKIKYMSRDNARTPMQWDDTEFAGFSKDGSWIDVNPNKDRVNVREQEKNPHSILNFYRKLIEIRTSSKAIKEGDYELYFPDHRKLYCFSRKSGDEMYLVLANYAKKETRFRMPKEVEHCTFKMILSNYEHTSKDDISILKPYEVRIYSKR